MISQIKVVQNDVLNPIDFNLQNSDGTALNLTGATALFKVQQFGNHALKFTRTMSLPDAVNGLARAMTASGDFDLPGNYIGEIELTYGSGQIITFPEIYIQVVPELPQSIT